MRLAVAALVALSACSAPRVADYADVGTTAVFLSQGYVELNPVIAAAGDAAPIAALGLKIMARTVIDQIKDEEQRETMHVYADAVSWVAACSNIVLITTGAASLPLGIACGIASLVHANKQGEE